MQPGVRRHLCRLLSLLGMSVFALMATDTGAADRSSNPMVNIKTMIEEIKNETATLDRIRLTEKLQGFIKDQDRLYFTAIDSRIIDDLAGLLSDQNDAVRYWAALALASIGPPAKRAVPALEAALKDIQSTTSKIPVGPDLTSESAILGALAKINDQSK